jgi:hypothetical protein
VELLFPVEIGEQPPVQIRQGTPVEVHQVLRCQNCPTHKQNPLQQHKGFRQSGWPDLNRRPLDPQSTKGLDAWYRAMMSCH